MNRQTLEEGAARLIGTCPDVPVYPDHRAVLDVLAEVWSPLGFRHVLSRGGWHRPGRVWSSAGALIDNDAISWIEQEWESCGEDMGLFCERHLYEGVQLSRCEGQTHFFVAPYGPEATQFIQLEIEELREVSDRPLLDPESQPDDLEDLLSPEASESTIRKPLGPPVYRFRRVTDMADFFSRMRGKSPDAPPACRFVEDWGHSSAAPRLMCDHWVFALSEHLDRFKQPVLSARPVSLDAGWNMLPADGSVERANILADFDKQRGYPAAWYFHMVSGAGVPKVMGALLGEDLAQGMHYLPEREVELLTGWLNRPYSA